MNNLEEITKQFPLLIEVNGVFPIEELEKTRLRVIRPIMAKIEDKLTLRPRKIEVGSKNAYQLNSHPELFEKVEHVVDSTQFNFGLLSNKINRIDIRNGAEKYYLK